MSTLLRFMTALSAVLLLLMSNIFTANQSTAFTGISVDTSETGATIPNIVSNVNIWEMGKQFINPVDNADSSIFNFTEYIQLMQCSGGNSDRDLFIDPNDTSTLTDYDFSSLLENCRGIISLGAKPVLILGSVPAKFSSGSENREFQANIYPPDNYSQYYDYIKAIAQSLVNEFGIDEVRTWRFGCMTEYENDNWFSAKSGDPTESMIEYCKLYDHTVQALLDVIGEDIFVGAHSMTVTEGLWDEALFIEHVAKGTNYANGGEGTHIDYLSASFYDIKPGEFTSGKTLPETISFLREAAEKYGLTDLIYGIDEGRILYGNSSGVESNNLLSRTCGYTWQAAYDARLYAQGIKNGLNYFSSWNYLSNGLLDGYPVITYHVADRISQLEGSRLVPVNALSLFKESNSEIDCLAGWNEDTQTLHLMAYNFKNNIGYSKDAKVSIKINTPQLDGKTVTVTKYVIDDDCNFFDEWLKDRKTYGIGDDCFKWSPDDAIIEATTTLQDKSAIKTYNKYLKAKYAEYAKLVGKTETAEVVNGKLELTTKLDASTVVFYEIKG